MEGVEESKQGRLRESGSDCKFPGTVKPDGKLRAEA